MAEPTGLDIAFFGSSLVSAWWNGACTYYRGLLRALAERGHRVTFYEPDAFDRQQHRDIPDPSWARVVVYQARTEDEVREQVAAAAGADVVVKASGVGVFDELLEREGAAVSAGTRVFWDVDAPATLARIEADEQDSLRRVLPSYDAVFTYGGGDRVVRRYQALGARSCHVVYNALDPTTHHRVEPDSRFEADLALLANRLPDREARVEELFLHAAELLPDKAFLLGGNGWDGKPMPPNVRWIGHVGTEDHNAFNCTPTAVLNVTRDSMVENGWSPATRVFEAAGVGACLVTDAWEGVEEFLAPDKEVLVARDGAEVARHVAELEPARAAEIGARAAARVLAEHTYADRAAEVDELLRGLVG
jgi:spore maturation protein CgeB